jgi:molybdenum cofactor cytidylyltransferase
MEGANKLVAPLGGAPLIARVVDAVLGSEVDTVVVVLGHQADRVQTALASRPVRFVRNPAHGEGLGASLRTGVEALRDEVDAALVVLGDMPWLRAEHVRRVLAGFDAGGNAGGDGTICVPTHGGRHGHPVLFGAGHFPELCRLQGDFGARAIVVRSAGSVREVPMDDSAVLVDVDTREALAAAQAADAMRA